MLLAGAAAGRAEPAPEGPGFAFVDPGLSAKPFKPAKNPIYRRLKDALENYRRVWGGLPYAWVPPGPALEIGAHGPRVAALRARLAMPGDADDYDEALSDRIAHFQRDHGLSETGVADSATIQALNAGHERYEQALEASLERASALPPKLGTRYILVDAAVGRMTLYDRGEEVLTMKVVTGKPGMPTPMMAGLARYLLFNPYWNVPEDLVRTSIAPKALAGGIRYVNGERLEVLSDYSDAAVALDPRKVNWRAVARGEQTVRVRQRPGPNNMMGRVKVMLPNPLGVYLHDTPLRADFDKEQRLASSGCIRLEDAMALARALAGDEAVDRALADQGEDLRVDLPEPVPVYVTYFTAWPTKGGVEFRPDVYARDRRMAALEPAAP